MSADHQRVEDIDRRIAGVRARVAAVGATLHVIDRQSSAPVYVIAHPFATVERDSVADVETWLDGIERRG